MNKCKCRSYGMDFSLDIKTMQLVLLQSPRLKCTCYGLCYLFLLHLLIFFFFLLSISVWRTHQFYTKCLTGIKKKKKVTVHYYLLMEAKLSPHTAVCLTSVNCSSTAQWALTWCAHTHQLVYLVLTPKLWLTSIAVLSACFMLASAILCATYLYTLAALS